MKKILALVAAVAMSVVGAFAFDLGTIQGTWQDARYDANWTFSGDGTIVLSLASTGEKVFTFTDSNVQNFQLATRGEGLTLTFDCAATHRSYKFVKPLSVNSDLNMTIDPDWTTTDYITTIKWLYDQQ